MRERERSGEVRKKQLRSPFRELSLRPDPPRFPKELPARELEGSDTVVRVEYASVGVDVESQDKGRCKESPFSQGFLRV